MLILTADHGNDPTFKDTDHTHEYVPLLVYQPNQTSKDPGIRQGFYDIAQSLVTLFNPNPPSPRKKFPLTAKPTLSNLRIFINFVVIWIAWPVLKNIYEGIRLSK